MQSSTLQAPAALGPAFSPVQKKRFDMSGYPSPPSSGRTEAEQDCVQSNVDQGVRHNDTIVEVQARARAIEVHISPRPEASQSLSPPASCEEEEEEEDEDKVEDDEYSNDDDYSDDQDGDATVTAMERSRSSTSWSDSVAPSSPSTSIATMSQSNHFHRTNTDARGGSPYVEGQLPMAPIRDTPRNPFLQGGPADVGHTGSNRSKKGQSRCVPRERGKMTYVFRGQRVTYADPYTSDSEDDDDMHPSSSGGSLMDRLQPKLLFPSVGKASVRPGSNIGGIAVKKSDIVPITSKSKPTLEMAVERQRVAGKKGVKSAVSHPLLERINRAGWSDDDEDDEEEYLHHGHNEQERATEERGQDIRQEEDYSDDEDMMAEEYNPFMQPSCNQASASFLHRLQQVQVTSSGQSRSGAVRAVHCAHRYNPYSQQQSQPRSRAHYAAAVPPPAYAHH